MEASARKQALDQSSDATAVTNAQSDDAAADVADTHVAVEVEAAVVRQQAVCDALHEELLTLRQEYQVIS